MDNTANTNNQNNNDDWLKNWTTINYRYCIVCGAALDNNGYCTNPDCFMKQYKQIF